MDPFYTPPEVARVLVAAATKHRRPTCVADFAAGSGELLVAAEKRWTRAQIIATDIDVATVRRLRQANPSWTVGRCDFLSGRSRRSSVLAAWKGEVPLVVLNPPFSYRGGFRRVVVLEGEEITCSPAMACALTALQFLSPTGEMICLLPAGSPKSERDEEAWKMLRRKCRVRFLGTNGHRTFAGCFPRTILVKAVMRPTDQKKPRVRTKNSRATEVKTKGTVTMVRGTIQMHGVSQLTNDPSLPLVHSTDLLASEVRLNGRRASGYGRTLSGPAVLVPRVGRPDRRKIALFYGDQTVALSDCVIALECQGIRTAESLRKKLVEQWPAVRRAYGGTCAPYITVNSLREILEKLGFRVTAQQ